MLSSIKYRALYNCSCFHVFYLRRESIRILRNMSVSIDTVKENMNDTHVNQKRQISDEDHNSVAKIQKVEDINATEIVQRRKVKNHALLLGYFGKDYYGMQRNPGMKTIEEDLINALLKTDLITEENFKNIQETRFQRAARTDKGVSAIRQVVNLKMPDNAKVADLNQYLPKEIRVFGIQRVTKGFNSKNHCTARTYRYIIPSYAFAPEDANFLKAEEELEVEARIEQLSTIDGKPYTEFKLSEELKNRINLCAKSLEGTHNFHNFTSKIKPLDPRASRYIMNFHCTKIFTMNGMEFVVLEVKGQSFVLHQIRKMVALIIGISRNIIAEDIINDVFSTERFHMPIAPALGLCLNFVHYDTYNKKYGSDGIHLNLDWDECVEEVQKFDNDYILKHVVDTEISEKTTFTWLAQYLAPNRFAFKDLE